MVGDTTFDDFCAQINRPFNSFEDAVNTTGVNTEDVSELKGCPGFDLALLNYAAYVRDVSLCEVRRCLVLTLRQNIVSTCPKNETVEQVSLVSWNPPILVLTRQFAVLRIV